MHKCTRCEEAFAEGDKRILSGCPSCGWTRFIYLPSPEIKPIPVEEPKVESIKIIDSGSYEVNLKKLLESREIVLAMKEDGKYIIHLPSLFQRRIRRA
jgi:hypothetical protein